MYNRYIPQSDGSYRRNRMEDQTPAPPPPAPVPEVPCEKVLPPCKQGGSAAGFLRNLLPKSFDTGDLFVVLLLLLIAGDSQEEKNTALLTLALYFFM